MDTSRWSTAFAMAACLLLGAEGFAAEWEFPNLNPFSTEKRSAKEPQQSSAWGFPKLPTLTLPKPQLPGFGTKASGRNEKSVLTKTKETLFPWTRQRSAPVKLTGTRRVTQGSTRFASQQDDGGSFFSSWFTQEEDSPPVPMAPHEWLGQPMPD